MNDFILDSPNAPLETLRNTNKYTCWRISEENKFIPSYNTIPQLPAGKYRIQWNSNENAYGFNKEEIYADELLDLPNGIFQDVLQSIDYFWSHKDLFEKYKFVYKRGILLHGNPGCGKTSLLALLAEQIIQRNGIIFSIQNTDDLFNYNRELKNSFRIIQPHTPVLTVFEDLDGLVSRPEDEVVLLNILDGINQMNNIVNVGCTNHPEKLQERILNRPSRFDKKYYIGLPDIKVRKYYFENKIKSEDIEVFGGKKFIDDIAIKTEGLTLAHLSEFIKSVFIFKNSVEDTLDVLFNMKYTTKNKDESPTIGFKK